MQNIQDAVYVKEFEMLCKSVDTKDDRILLLKFMNRDILRLCAFASIGHFDYGVIFTIKFLGKKFYLNAE